MQSAGQAAAHSEQPTHFSRPVSAKRWRRCRPRKRGYTGTFSSGYWKVVVPSGMRANVVLRPRSVSPNARYTPPAPPGCGARCTAMTSSPGFQAMWGFDSVERHDDDRRDEGAQGRQRQEHLPAEAHQLVVAQARQRRADPEEKEDDREALEQHHERVHPGGGVDPERQQPAAEVDGGDDQRDD